MKFRSVLNAIFIVFTLTLTFLLVKIEYGELIRENNKIVETTLQQTEASVLDWPNQRSFRLDLKDTYHSSYIYLELSNADTYVLEFINENKDHSHYLVVNTYDWAWFYLSDGIKPILQLIPSYIVEDGYTSINIKPIDGDSIYFVQNIQLVDDKAELNIDHYINTIDFEVKQLEIFIDEDNYQKIEDKREEALELGILLSDDGDEVDATFISEGEESKGTLRLKGDWTDHLAGDKWSFRIDLKSSYAIYGMSEFSIQDPFTRIGMREALIYKFYQSEGGVALRYDFMDVFVNGIYKGVYAYEEFFTTDMIEASSKRDGPIIKANEDTLWASRVYDATNITSDNMIETFKYSSALKDDYRLDLSEYAINLYQSYQKGELTLSQTFDVDLLAKYHAIEDIFVAEHGSRVWHNIRYYLNPITLKLEPVPFDELSNEFGEVYTPFGFTELDRDPVYYALYIKYLREYSTKIFDYMNESQTWMDNTALMISRDGSYVGDFNFLTERIRFINANLNVGQ